MNSIAPSLSSQRIVPPLVTPLTSDHRVDRESMARLLKHVLAAGVDGVLVLGSTGEGGHLSDAERDVVIRISAEMCAGHAGVMVGIQSLNTTAACESAKRAVGAGANYVLIPAPTALDLTQTELAAHFSAVASAVDSPVVAYHVPSRTPTSPEPKLVAELAAAGVLSGVKDSSSDLANHRELVRLTRNVSGFSLQTGSETCIDMAFLAGFTGAIPGLANVWPELHVRLGAAAVKGDWSSARRVQDQLGQLSGLYALSGARGHASGAMGALKEVLVQRGIIESSTLTVPFSPPTDELSGQVRSFLAASSEMSAWSTS